MPTSQNGWPADPDPAVIGIAPCTVAGVPLGGGVAAGPVMTVLAHVALQVHLRVEPLQPGQCWGYNYRPITGGTELSNHASGTAIDLNSTRHPLGQVGTFTPVQVAEIHRILAEVDGVVRWGGDYTGRVDEMHFEINADAAAVAAVARRVEATLLRRMYDSTNPNDIPADVQVVAGYVSGPYAWPASAWARFASIPQVRIATQAAHNVGNCLDVERGDATPEQAPAWAVKRRAAGEDPSVYCNAATWPAVRQAFRSQGVPEPHYWIAAWDGVRAIPAGAVAKQFKGSAQTGGHWDESAAADYWPGIDQQQEEDMQLNELVNFRVQSSVDNGERNLWDFHIQNEVNIAALQKQLAAVTAAVATGDLDPQAVLNRIDTAVRESTREAVSTVVLPALREVVHDVLGEDNTAEADAIVTRLAERLRPAA